MTEKELIKQVVKKRRKAQEELFERYKRLWYSICLRYHSNTDDANDALQNALVNIFTKIKQFDPDKGNFGSWSSRIVVNENLLLIRKRSRAFVTDELNDEIHVYDESESALDRLSAKELTKLISQMPDGYRTVFNLYVIEGFTHVEIAEMLGISVGTSKSQLYKARTHLQEKLELLIGQG